MIKKIVILVVSGLSIANAKVRIEKVQYGNNEFEGVFVIPEKVKANNPAILMVHNWMGVSSETEAQATRFAEKGYIVFAADIYGKASRPKNQQEAGQLAGKYKTDRKLFRERLKMGLEVLLAKTEVDKNKIGAIGYCFGGTGVIELARSGAKVKAVISFHGGLDSPRPEEGKNISASVMAHHGANDPFVKAEDLAAFEKEMKDAKVQYQLIKYPGAVHSFTDQGAGSDPSKGAAYQKEADLASFDKTIEFLSQLNK